MASVATTRGAACPRQVSVDPTRHDWIKTALVDTTRLKNCSPGRDVWTRSTGLGLVAAGGHESAAIRRAYCCTAERFAIVAPLFIEYLPYFHCLLFKVIIYNLIPTIFLVLSIKLI